ncbi:MAG: double-strand break repair protein AddB [Sphingomicrobium sp.]|nr:double-strand break repair protein AddB [Sphingomonadales bacterium]
MRKGDADRRTAGEPLVYTIPAHRSFADALASGLIAAYGRDPVGLAKGRILLPTNRAVRAVTEAFVRASGGGLVLPRLIPIGDPELDERIGGALDPADTALQPAVDPLERLLTLAKLVRGEGESVAEALRLAADLARTLDQLTIAEVSPAQLVEAAADAPELARHWQVSLDRLRAIIDIWPGIERKSGRMGLAERRNRLLRSTAERWRASPPECFTVAAGVTTNAPAVATLLGRVARLPDGAVILPGLALGNVMPAAEWDALGPQEEDGRRTRGEPTHPQFHLKQLLDALGVARDEVRVWRAGGRASSPAVRGRAVMHAMTAADFSEKWSALPPRERRLTGIRAAELSDPAAEAMTIAVALREALETPEMTAALVTPDRVLAARVSAILTRWGVEANDSAGRPLSQAPPGTLLLGILAAAAEGMAPVALLALLKHPLVGGEGPDRLAWLDRVRALDLALRGPRPPTGLAGLDQHCAAKAAWQAAWAPLRAAVEPLDRLFDGALTLARLAAHLRECATSLAGDAAWRGPAGRMAGDLLAEIEAAPVAATFELTASDAVPLFRQLFDERPVRPPYGGHQRIQILGLLEARLQQADLMVLGGLNEGTWPAEPRPDPWLAPRIRANLGLPGLDLVSGLAAHDFASALGAPRVLITRARRDGRSPTVASRLWLRLQAMTGGLPRDLRLERLAAAIDSPDGPPEPVARPAPRPPINDRPRRIAVTDLDRLQADPFAFYAKAMLRLRSLDPVDAEHSAAWKGTAVHAILEQWLKDDDCDPATLLARAQALIAGDAIHPMLRALWQPRLLEAIKWVAAQEEANRAEGRRPKAAEVWGETELGGVTLFGKADRIDILPDGGLAIVDYKTGKAPARRAVDEGFALQLGLLGLIARAGGFEVVAGEPEAHEYWSLAKDKDSFGKCSSPDKDLGAAGFLDRAERQFLAAAAKWLTGDVPFTAKLNPAYAPYGDYDQLMRLEEWYGRE